MESMYLVNWTTLGLVEKAGTHKQARAMKYKLLIKNALMILIILINVFVGEIYKNVLHHYKGLELLVAENIKVVNALRNIRHAIAEPQLVHLLVRGME